MKHLEQTIINAVDMSVAVPCNWNKHPEQKHQFLQSDIVEKYQQIQLNE